MSHRSYKHNNFYNDIVPSLYDLTFFSIGIRFFTTAPLRNIPLHLTYSTFSRSYESSEEPTTPLPQLLPITGGDLADDEAEVEEAAAATPAAEEDIYWIPSRVRQMPQTSSRLSMMSRGSGRSSLGSTGWNSPGLSPIKRREEAPSRKAAWGSTYRRQLFRIDETIIIDSGYSDRSGAASSRTATASTRRSTPAPSPFIAELEERLARPGPYVLKSILV